MKKKKKKKGKLTNIYSQKPAFKVLNSQSLKLCSLSPSLCVHDSTNDFLAHRFSYIKNETKLHTKVWKMYLVYNFLIVTS